MVESYIAPPIFTPGMIRDDYRHKGLRRNMLRELREMGIQDESVLQAMDAIPRHAFLDPAFVEHAYRNKAFQIGAGQTISRPHTVARQTELLAQVLPKVRPRVLEIGTGSGYQCAVLCAMGYKVFSIERQRELFDKTGPLMGQLGFKPHLFYGDGYKGKPTMGPFHGIIVTCGAPAVPDALLKQLAIGGRLVIPVGEGDTQEMFTFDRLSDNEFAREDHGSFAFVPMLERRTAKAP
jgi:protein-L-isoaspartate(D-aspartate) O-methyltransferase